ncbi:MAG: hypothetical protein GYB50_18805 [Rhodobacteraceae bacterium]|nr:hypothetical protein [Paracoccaceae bacterium]
MASRPIFLVDDADDSLVTTVDVEFKWYAGMSLARRRMSAQSLISAGRNLYPSRRFLEVSRMSDDPLGEGLSAFNLRYPEGPRTSGRPVECVFQSSKVFQHGGPFRDLLGAEPGDAKRDERLQTSGRLIEFNLEGEKWSSQPLTAFYDWIYMKALDAHPMNADAVMQYDAFTDIAFNPAKSFSCQAHAVALYVSLRRRNKLNEALGSQASFLGLLESTLRSKRNQAGQLNLF